ncbi:MAG: MBL fold metallo-hydrolase [Deltaproteobacteria bacterium]|nr:MBL fold metallo-hydrolase [Deltaproteobacteria bacterium]
MVVRFWGVRGSIAAGGSEFSGVGGNTSCVEVRAGDELLVFDAGTGLRALGAEMKPKQGHFFFSHLHWDHIQGFPFFGPAFVPGNHFTLHGPGKGAGQLLAALEKQMSQPTFPVTLDAMGARLDFTEVKDGQVTDIGAARVTARALNHPGGCLGYRVEVGGKSVVYATDFEPLANGDVDPVAVALALHADVLIADAQYTADEYEGRCGPCRKGWGHNAIHHATALAKAAKVKTLVLFHHDPSHDDIVVQELEEMAKREFAPARAAREGLQLEV